MHRLQRKYSRRPLWSVKKTLSCNKRVPRISFFIPQSTSFRCKDGFYGNPTLGIECKACPCPGGASGNSFAATCSLNTTTSLLTCSCRKGYTGLHCDQCSSLYYGEPLKMGGSCSPCKCNGNNAMSDRETSCDARTGKCNACLYSTAGWNCEHCANGFYGNALEHGCKREWSLLFFSSWIVPDSSKKCALFVVNAACQCNAMGTEGNSKTNCSPDTGHCACLPKVLGRMCDECAENYWNLESGKGCEYCGCDTSGTYANSTSCDQRTGQCHCLTERGGRRCDECPFGYWGNPNTLGGCKSRHVLQGITTWGWFKTRWIFNRFNF